MVDAKAKENNWNPKFDKFFAEHEALKAKGAKLERKSIQQYGLK